MKTHKSKLAVVKVAYAWQQVDDQWQQFLVRWWNDKSVSIDPLIKVYPQVSVCLHCLSHDVSYTAPVVRHLADLRPELQCHTCGITYKVLD